MRYRSFPQLWFLEKKKMAMAVSAFPLSLADKYYFKYFRVIIVRLENNIILAWSRFLLRLFPINRERATTDMKRPLPQYSSWKPCPTILSCVFCRCIVFRQGDEGKAWYLILHGAVIVETYSKGVVETLYEGEDFGGLALIHNVPR